jgi:hypothetical protein
MISQDVYCFLGGQAIRREHVSKLFPRGLITGLREVCWVAKDIGCQSDLQAHGLVHEADGSGYVVVHKNSMMRTVRQMLEDARVYGVGKVGDKECNVRCGWGSHKLYHVHRGYLLGILV